ncbi:MAG: type II toxin-antitoxin system PemK/MazF family toxin [Candidatus Velthaea sp.]
MVAKRSEIYWVALDPAVGSEIQKTRPCIVVSPDELNSRLSRVIVAPLTSTVRQLRFRVTTTVAGRPSSVVLDQLRTVDTVRLGKRIGKVDARTMGDILTTLQAMFAP